MADFFTQFSCHLDVCSAGNARRAEDVWGELAAELYREDGGYPGFQVEVDHEHGPGALWIHSDEYGEPEHVIRFVLRCAEALNLQGCWGFTWSQSCSKPRLDSFGGGAHVIDLGKRQSIADIDCTRFVAENMPQDPALASTAESVP